MCWVWWVPEDYGGLQKKTTSVPNSVVVVHRGPEMDFFAPQHPATHHRVQYWNNQFYRYSSFNLFLLSAGPSRCVCC